MNGCSPIAKVWGGSSGSKSTNKAAVLGHDNMMLQNIQESPSTARPGAAAAAAGRSCGAVATAQPAPAAAAHGCKPPHSLTRLALRDVVCVLEPPA
jgi:hypothetical protein